MNCHGNMKLYRALHHKNRRVIFKDVMWKDELCFFGLMISLRAVHNTNSGKRWDISLPIQQFLFPHLTVIGTMKQTTIIYINSWRTFFPCINESAAECKNNFEDFELPSIVREMVDISRKCIFVVSFITRLIILYHSNYVSTQTLFHLPCGVDVECIDKYHIMEGIKWVNSRLPLVHLCFSRLWILK